MKASKSAQTSKSIRSFTGTSSRGDIAEAIREAVKQAIDSSTRLRHPRPESPNPGNPVRVPNLSGLRQEGPGPNNPVRVEERSGLRPDGPNPNNPVRVDRSSDVLVAWTIDKISGKSGGIAGLDEVSVTIGLESGRQERSGLRPDGPNPNNPVRVDEQSRPLPEPPNPNNPVRVDEQ